jgi:hypothetical protein
VGSLFDQSSPDFSYSSPNYSFSEISNSKSQLLPVPVVYGRVRMGGNIFLQNFYDDTKQKMDMFVGLSHGPINRVISVYANDLVLYGDGSDTYTYWTLTGGEWVEVSYAEYVAWEGTKQIRDSDGNPATIDLQECSCDIHLGEEGQLKDSRETGEYTYPGLAYLGITLKVQDGLSGNPTITTELEGRKLWTPAGVRYSNNPVWCIWDLLSNTKFGGGFPSDGFNLAAAQDAAAYCDELVDGKPRYSLNYIIDQQRPAPDILRDMCACFNGFITDRETITIHCNRPVSAPVKTINLDTDIVEGSLRWFQKSREETFNRVTVEWVDPGNYYERTSTPFEDEADMEARGVYERNISLLGVTDAAQAARLGEQALKIAQEIDNFAQVKVPVRDWDVEVGDVVALTDNSLAEWNGKWFHVAHMKDDYDNEEGTITFAEYSASTYIDTPSSIPDTPDNPDPTPATDNYSNLLLTDIGVQQEDGTYLPKIRVQYTPPTASMKEHVINWWNSEEEVGEKKVSPQVRDVLVSEGIQTGVTLTVRVWGTDVNGKQRTGIIGQITPGKDDVPPGAPTGLTATGWFGAIVLNWINPETNENGTPCTDLAYIEIWESSEDDRDTAVLIGRVNGTNFQRHLGSFRGRYYWVRAVDTSGNVSQWNAEAGVYGYSDQETHQDIVDYLLENPYIQEAIADLNTPIDSLAEAGIKNALADYEGTIQDSLRQRKIDQLAEAAIQGALTEHNNLKYSIATIREEQITREAEDEALASQILTISAILGDPDDPGEDTVFAALAEEKTARAREDEALAQNILALSVVVGDPWDPDEGTVWAGIREEQRVRAAADTALAEDVSMLSAAIGDPENPADGTVYAAVRDETQARVAADSAVASNVNTLQTIVNGNTNSVQILNTSINGIKGKVAVKIDTNGYITGWELIGGADSGSMVLHVDNFMVGRPGATNKYPFVIGVVDGVQRISMDNAFIQDGAIKNAKIQDLTVGRIKIMHSQFITMEHYRNASRYTFSAVGHTETAARKTITVEDGYPVTLIFNAMTKVMEGRWDLSLYRGGSKIASVADWAFGSLQTGATYSFLDSPPYGGTYTYDVKIKLTASDPSTIAGNWFWERNLILLHGKR